MAMEENREPKFMIRTANIEEERAFDYVGKRQMKKPCGVFASTMHLIKGALGAGILSGHVAFMKAGVAVAMPIVVVLGIYMTCTLLLLLRSAQRLCCRMKITRMSYSDVGEAALTVFPNKRVAKLAKLFRYIIDGTIMVDLFGSCCCYQIIVAKTAKQIVENLQETTLEANGSLPLVLILALQRLSIVSWTPGSPHIRVYLIGFLLPVIAICLIPHLKWLAPFSGAANALIAFCVFVTIYYAMQENPGCENLILAKSFSGALQMVGMTIFSISCAAIVIPVENNMADPYKFPVALCAGMTVNIILVVVIAFFGYMAYLEKSESPITVNFPLTILPKIMKVAIALMIIVTHALNFWIPFVYAWYYIKRFHKNSKHLMRWELFYRALTVTIICIIAIIFPKIEAIMGFLGCICLSNIAFIWPAVMYLLVTWERPGLGIYKWRLIVVILLLIFGFFLLLVGGWVNVYEMISVFMEVNINSQNLNF